MPLLFCMMMKESTDLLLTFCLSNGCLFKKNAFLFSSLLLTWKLQYSCYLNFLKHCNHCIFFHILKASNAIVTAGQGFSMSKRIHWSQLNIWILKREKTIRYCYNRGLSEWMKAKAEMQYYYKNIIIVLYPKVEFGAPTLRPLKFINWKQHSRARRVDKNDSIIL